MAKAYLKIFVERGREEEVRDGLLKINAIKAADLTAGEQDLICVVEADTHDDIIQVVLGEVRAVPGISRTITNLAI